MITNENKPMSLREWGVMLILSIIWGGSFFFTKVALMDLTPLTLVALRLCVGAMFLNAILLYLKIRLPKDLQVWIAFLVMGFLNNMLPFCLIVWGQTHIASGLASILNATVPLFTIVVAYAFMPDEKPGVNRIFGVIIGFIGIIIMIGPDVMMGFGSNVIAQMACLSASLSYALAGFYGRRFKVMGIPPLATAAGQVSISAVIMIMVAVIFDSAASMPVPSLKTVGAILALGGLSTAIAYTLYFKLLASAGASNLMLVTFLIPITAILLGVLVLGEHLLFSEVVGMGMIALGLLAIDGRLFKKMKKSLAL